MAVLAEFLSVIVPVAAIERRFPGGLAGYEQAVPNDTYCCDGVLARVGFMTPAGVATWIELLERQGLVFLRENRAVDIVVVDQRHGPTTACDWLLFVQSFEEQVALAASPDEGPNGFELVTPAGWTRPEPGSVQFVPTAAVTERLEILRERDGVLEVRDRITGQHGYVAKTPVIGPGATGGGRRTG